jgi:hypothetical protein
LIPPSKDLTNNKHFSFCHSIHPDGHDRQVF